MDFGTNIPNAKSAFAGHLTFNQQAALRRAVAKLVVIGEEAGVMSDEMISLLQAGLTVQELLHYVAARQRVSFNP
jgi:hypothetical protein